MARTQDKDAMNSRPVGNHVMSMDPTAVASSSKRRLRMNG